MLTRLMTFSRLISARNTAPKKKIWLAYWPSTSASGVSRKARNRLIGTATRVPITEPEAILRIARVA